uniref:HTH OST-type domain-containing protein n=1 Tax=Nelumbo nucifera TaxID=4432 RepID=A0A822XQ07_NELNU|nr:TPA_asm: hypothetical protein HUJ06_023993 [Nelumbo nucifera]
MLAHCQKLVTEILEECPEGFNMGSFKRLFLVRYGYPLDHQILGYQKLAALLQNVPGVRIEATYILPARTFSQDCYPEAIIPNVLGNSGSGKASNSVSELSDSARKGNDCDPLWEELGPISETDKEHSDSGGDDRSPLQGSEGQGKTGINEKASSLSQILDSWLCIKDDNGRRDRSQNCDELVDYSRTCSKPSDSSGVEVKGKKGKEIIGPVDVNNDFLSDKEHSDSGDDSSPLRGSEGQEKTRINEKDGGRKDQRQNCNEVVDCSRAD